MSQRAPHERFLEDLSCKAENAFCADCGGRDPKWASATLGIFICYDCAGIHRSLGTHISFVRSVTLDKWKPHQVEQMKTIGNKRANEFWEGNYRQQVQKPHPHATPQQRDVFIRAKYERRMFTADQDPPAAPAPSVPSVAVPSASPKPQLPTPPVTMQKQVVKPPVTFKAGNSALSRMRQNLAMGGSQKEEAPKEQCPTVETTDFLSDGPPQAPLSSLATRPAAQESLIDFDDGLASTLAEVSSESVMSSPPSISPSPSPPPSNMSGLFSGLSLKADSNGSSRSASPSPPTSGFAFSFLNSSANGQSPVGSSGANVLDDNQSSPFDFLQPATTTPTTPHPSPVMLSPSPSPPPVLSSAPNTSSAQPAPSPIGHCYVPPGYVLMQGAPSPANPSGAILVPAAMVPQHLGRQGPTTQSFPVQSSANVSHPPFSFASVPNPAFVPTPPAAGSAFSFIGGSSAPAQDSSSAGSSFAFIK
eukprot:GILK01009722.1.p1 GENE.GILK01009722.1~~GILK01009722.1.p1  ORF type:complete len:475 (+),score=31.76 GILK01009722.1:46-1470(+)